MPHTQHNRALRIIAEDHRRPQFSLTPVVGRLDIAPLQEHQQFVACCDLEHVAQFAAVDLRRIEFEQAIEAARIVACGHREFGVGEIGPPPADAAEVLQKRLHPRCKDRVTGVDGILRIADQMREAILVLVRVLVLLRKTIRQPHVWSDTGEKIDRHALAARRRDDVIDGRGS